MLAQLGLAVVIGLTVGLAISWGVAASRMRRYKRLAVQVSTTIEPFLRRRAAEVGIEPGRPVWTARHTAEERVNFASSLAQELLDEARGVETTHSNTALAQTDPSQKLPTAETQAVGKLARSKKTHGNRTES